MDESILNSTKKLLGIESDYTQFDQDILVHINAAISMLIDIGLGPKTGFIVDNAEITFKDYLGDDISKCPEVKTYIYYKVKLGFDPPANATIVNSINDLLKETEWRIWMKANPPQKEGENSK